MPERSRKVHEEQQRKSADPQGKAEKKGLQILTSDSQGRHQPTEEEEAKGVEDEFPLLARRAEALEQELRKTEEQVNFMKEQLKLLEEEKNDLQQNLKQSQNHSNVVAYQMEKFQEANEHLKETLAEKEKALAELSENFHAQIQLNTNYSEVLENLKSENSKLAKTIDELVERLSRLDQKEAAIESNQQSSIVDFTKLQQENQELVDKCQGLQDKVSDYQRDVSGWHDKIHALESKEKELELVKTEREEQLQSINDYLKKERDELATQVSKLEQDMYNQTVQNEQNEVTRLRSQEDLKVKESQDRKRLQGLENNVVWLRSQLKESTDSAIAKDRLVEEMKAQLEQMKIKVKDAIEAKSLAETNLSQESSYRIQAEERSEEYLNIMDDLKLKIRDLEHDVNQEKAYKESVQSRLAETENDLQTQLDQEKKYTEDLKSQLSEFGRKNIELEGNYKHSLTCIDRLQQLISSIQMDLEESRDKLGRLATENLRISNRLEQETHDHESMQDLLAKDKEIIRKQAEEIRRLTEISSTPSITDNETLVVQVMRSKGLEGASNLSCQMRCLERCLETNRLAGVDPCQRVSYDLAPSAVFELPIGPRAVGFELAVFTGDEYLGHVIIPSTEFTTREWTDYPLQRKFRGDEVTGELQIHIERFKSIDDPDTY